MAGTAQDKFINQSRGSSIHHQIREEKLRSQSEDPLSFWKAENGRFPKIATLVGRYLCPPWSSLQVREPLAYQNTLSVTISALSVTPENMEMNIFLKYSLRTIGYDVESLIVPPADWNAPNRKEFDFDNAASDSDEDCLQFASGDEDSGICYSDSDEKENSQAED